MIDFLESLNFIIFILFLCCYSYQFFYVGISLFRKIPNHISKKNHKYAVIISARNESKVIRGLLESIKLQKYPKDLIDIFVVADNCTDNTADIARKCGARVFERNNLQKIGKSYALNYAFYEIEKLYGISYYEGYLFFDADNILDINFIREINKVFDNGYDVVTSYRNSKNYGDNWISAGYALWFLRESRFLNGARMRNNTSCSISGTGFLVSREIIQADNGWIYNLMTEDIEFTVDKVIQGKVIGFCEKAILYDEQPIDFKTSWNQRLRWAKGFYQVMHKYGCKLLHGCFSKKGFQCYDMLATIAPAALLTLCILIINLFSLFYGLASSNSLVVDYSLYSLWATGRNIYLSLFFFGLITLISEWKRIYCKKNKKILYLFTFPIFMFTYVPIAIVALFKIKKITWVPIEHTIQVPLNNYDN